MTILRKNTLFIVKVWHDDELELQYEYHTMMLISPQITTQLWIKILRRAWLAKQLPFYHSLKVNSVLERVASLLAELGCP